MMCLGVCFLASNFFGILWASWTSWKGISFARLGKFSLITCSNKFSIFCSFSSPSGTLIILMLERLKLSWRFLSLSSFFEFLFLHSFLVGCFFLASASYCWFESQFPYLHCWSPVYFSLFHFIAFTFFSILWPHSTISVSILITSVLNCASDRLAVSSSLSCIFRELWSVLSFGPYIFLSQHTCYVIRAEP